MGDAPGQRRRLGQGPVQRPHRLPLEDGLGARRPARPLQRLRRLGGGHRAVPRHVLRRQRHARVRAAYASYPFDTVRRRLQMQSEKPQEEWVYKGTMDCFGKIAAEEGVGALFKGAGANALRTVGSALVLVMYGELKGILAGAAGK